MLTNPDADHPSISIVHGYIDTHSVCASVGRFLPQLRRLTVKGYNGEYGQNVRQLFTKHNTSHTLTSLDIDTVLSKGLIRLLLNHAPGLKQLHVESFPAGTDGGG